MFPGKHLFLLSDRPGVLAAIRDALQQTQVVAP
jgi:surfactin synthase thioesterase subunit